MESVLPKPSHGEMKGVRNKMEAEQTMAAIRKLAETNEDESKKLYDFK